MRYQSLFIFFIIIIYLANGIATIPRQSVTWDEGAHFSYGIRILQGRPERVNMESDNSKMPVTALNTIPRIFQQFFNKGLKKDDGGVSDIMNGRYVTLFFSVLILLLVYKWTSQLYGSNAALLAFFITAFCPNLTGSATLITTDTYTVFFVLATMYLLWRYCNTRTTRNFMYFVVLLALCQLVKQTLVHLYVVCFLCLLINFLNNRPAHINFKKLFIKTGLFILINWVVITAGFCFYKSFMQLGDYTFYSHFFQTLQTQLPRGFRVPTAQPFLAGLDMVKYYEELGCGFTGNPESSCGNVTILGHNEPGKSYWYYYFITLLYKTALPVFILLGMAFFYRNKKRNFFLNNEMFLLLPVVYFLIVLNFFNNIQIGIRHIIFIYPLLYIFCGQVMQYASQRVKYFVVAPLCLWLVISTAFYFRNSFAYSNELIVNKTAAYKKIGVSNISFNQGQYMLQDYLQHHPEASYAPAAPKAGIFVLQLDDYVDIWNTGKYNWLKHIEPAGNVGNGCFVILKVEQNDIQ